MLNHSTMRLNWSSPGTLIRLCFKGLGAQGFGYHLLDVFRLHESSLEHVPQGHECTMTRALKG